MKKESFQILGLFIGIALIVVTEIMDFSKHKGEENESRRSTESSNSN